MQIKKSHEWLCAWQGRGRSWEPRLRSDCSFWHHCLQPRGFKAGRIFLLGVIPATAAGHWAGAWLDPPGLLGVCAEQMGSVWGAGSRVSVCCTHGGKWARLWGGGDFVHVLVTPGVSHCAFGSNSIFNNLLYLYGLGSQGNQIWLNCLPSGAGKSVVGQSSAQAALGDLW